MGYAQSDWIRDDGEGTYTGAGFFGGGDQFDPFGKFAEVKQIGADFSAGRISKEEYNRRMAEKGWHEVTPSRGLLGDIAHTITSAPGAALDLAKQGVELASHVPGLNLAVGAGKLAWQAHELALKGIGELQKTPVWNIAQTGVSFIPGVGQAVSGGMAAAAALGSGKSLRDAALQAAKNALPGGPAVAAAFDVATGLLAGRNPGDAVLAAVRSQVPGGELGRAAFDAAAAIAKGASADQVAIGALSQALPQDARNALQTATAAYQAAKTGNVGGAIKAVGFHHLPGPANAVAKRLEAHPDLRSMPVDQLAKLSGTSNAMAKTAIATWMNRFRGTAAYEAHHVGDTASLNDCCAHEGLYMNGMGTTGALASRVGMPVPGVTVALSRVRTQRQYERGHAGIKQAILAHGLLARHSHNTGELTGDGGWMIRSGDTGSAIAKKITGDANRWRELPAANPGMKITGTGTSQQLSPWRIGQRVTIPAAWLGSAVPVMVPVPPTPVVSAPAPAPSAPVAPVTPPSGVHATIKIGASGPDVRLLQSYLGVKVDGAFGPQTDAAVRAFQKSKGLLVDGIVGPQTWAAVLAQGGPRPASTPTPVSIPMPTPASPMPAATPGPMLPPAPAISISTPEGANLLTSAATAILLGTFFQLHGIETARFPGSPVDPMFGTTPEDLAGPWGARQNAAMKAFQLWYNAQGGDLPTDGQPDQRSVNALQAQVDRDLGAPPVVIAPPTPTPISAPAVPAISKPASTVTTLPETIVYGTPPPKAPPAGTVTTKPTPATPAKGGDNTMLFVAGGAALLLMAEGGRRTYRRTRRAS